MLFSLLIAATGAHAGDACRVTPDCDAPFVCIRRQCVDKPQSEPTPLPAPAPPQSNEPRTQIKWQSGDPVPVGAHVETQHIKSLWLSGLIIDLAAWALRGTFTGLACANTAPCSGAQVAGAFIPVIGAWVSIADAHDDTAVGALAFSGVLEAGGFVMLVLGAVLQRDVLVWDSGTARIQLMPLATPSSSGFAMSGRF